MPNYCDYSMRVKGEKANVEKFYSYLGNDYCYKNDNSPTSYPKKTDEEFMKEYSIRYDSKDGTKHLYTNAEKHLYRVFEAYLNEEYENDDGKYLMWITGYCAWSIYCCMFEGPFSYYTDCKRDDEFAELRNEHATSVPTLSKELGLEIEIFSSEPGCCFAEHYLVKDGDIVANEEYEYNEYCLYDYETKEEAQKDLGIEISDNEWGEDYFYRCDIDPNNPEWSI
ncbi:MAG: hypothetical protein IJI66_14120 [Erysipelotrichaceae bacterium]|nr:hypothetical protein [Erysipelotrichaceae bacterium]